MDTCDYFYGVTVESVKSGWINAGGDIRVFGEIAWPIHVKNVNGEFLNVLSLKNMAIATSNSATESNNRFSGKMLSSGKDSPFLGTWTVVAKTAWRADALTKVAANSLDSEREKVVKKLGGFLITSNRSENYL